MVLSPAELDAALLNPMGEFVLNATSAKDLDVVMSFYHPDAVVIHEGVGAYYGHAAIRRVYEPFLHKGGGIRFVPTYAEDSNDGDYQLRRGRWGMVGDSSLFEYETILRRYEGRYLVCYDRFKGPDPNLYLTCCIS